MDRTWFGMIPRFPNPPFLHKLLPASAIKTKASVCFVASAACKAVTSAHQPFGGATSDLALYLSSVLAHFAVSHWLALLPAAEARSTRALMLVRLLFPMRAMKGNKRSIT